MASYVEIISKRLWVCIRLAEVGILSGCSISLKRMDLRRSYFPRPPSAALFPCGWGMLLDESGVHNLVVLPEPPDPHYDLWCRREDWYIFMERK